MVICRDTREQKPYMFTRLPKHLRSIPYTLQEKKLDFGDYAVCRDCELHPNDAPELSAVVERKSLADLYSTVSQSRKRFEKELSGLQLFGYAAIVIEAELDSIVKPNKTLKHPSKYSPRSMVASLLAWSQRYNVHMMFCPGREAGLTITYLILERWYKDGIQNYKNMNASTEKRRKA